MKLKPTVISLGVLAATLSIATTAVALDAAAVEKARSDYMHSLGKPAKAMRDELQKASPDIAALKAYAADIAKVAPDLPAHFPAGSGPDSGVKTEAKANIWTDAAGFKKDADGLASAATALNAAAQGGNIDAVKAAFGNLGQTCKTCHTTYKTEDH
jgi:cytochrome c556